MSPFEIAHCLGACKFECPNHGAADAMDHSTISISEGDELAVVRRSTLDSLRSSLDSGEDNVDNIKYPRETGSISVSEHSTSTWKSEREKVEEFTIQRNLEKLRVFYQVLQVAMLCLITGVLLTGLTEILWRLIPAGWLSESIISGIAALAWFLTSMTIVVVSLCPQEELDIEAFVASRPGLTARFALLPGITGGMRALEFPFPRWISIVVAIAWLLQGCVGCSCCIRCNCGRKARRYFRMLSFVDLMQLWYLDVILSSAINEAAMEEPGIWTSVWLLVHAAFAIIIVLWLRWRSNLRKTETFHLASYLALSWNSSYFACRAIDLTLGHKEWEEGRQEDIAIMAAMGFASLILFPMLFTILVGQRRLFHKLATWLEHSRSRRLQDGAFMAMLLDSYVVEVGQPWWPTEKEVAACQGNLKVKAAPKEDLLRASYSSISVDISHQHEPRPGFVAGVVIAAADDALSFTVECQVDAQTVQIVEVERGQEVLAWPELLKMGRKNLRCVDWAALSPEVLRQNSPSFSDFRLSRPANRGEVIDFFVSHSWSDSPAQKWRAMQLVVEQFYQKNGRYPTFWIDKFCIDQNEIADGLRVLPVNVMSCRKMLCLSGKTYHNRLWCAWELCVLLSFMSMEMALKQIVVIALSQSALMELTSFDCSKARCYNPNEEFRLRRVIDAIGKHRFEIKIRALGQQLLDRDVNGGGLLTAGSGNMSFAFSSEGSAQLFARVEEPVEPVEAVEPVEEDPVVEVAF